MTTQQIVFKWIEYAAAGAILLLAARFVAGRLRQPADRINLILMSFVSAAVVPLVVSMAPLPAWHLGLVAVSQPGETGPVPAVSEPPASPQPTRRPVPESRQIRLHPAPAVATDLTLETRSRATASVVLPPQRLDPWSLAALGLVTMYSLAVGLFVVEGILGARWLRRMSARARPAGKPLTDLWMRVTEGCGGAARVLVSADVTTPLTYGCLRPTVLVPEAVAAGDPAALGFCLRHEWSHIANGDLRRWRLVWACQLLLWFQPLFWVLRRELRVCQDFLADHRAAGAGRDAIEYSELLMVFARQRLGRSVAGAIAFLDRSSQLSRRIKMLLTSAPALRTRSPLAFCLAAGTLSLACAVLIGAVRLDSVQADDVQSANQLSDQRDNADSDAQRTMKVVRGRVVDAAGMPVADARLWLPLRFQPRRVVEGRTDKEGRFELKIPAEWIGPRVRGSGWTVWAYAAGHGVATQSAYEALRGNSETEIEIQLRPQRTTRFKVLTPAGEPLAGALVEPQNYRTQVGYDLVPEEMLPLVSARTDAEGLATLPAVRSEPLFRVQIVSDQFGKQTIRVDRDAEQAVRNIRLRETGRIEGRLVGERPEWLRGVRVSFSVDNQEACDGEAQVVTDDEGRFVVPIIASGGPVHTYVDIDPSLPVRPRLNVNDNLFLTAGETLQLEIPLVPAVKVHGRVQTKDSGKPVANVEISLGYGGFRQSDDAVTDEEGRFEGRVLPGPVRAHIIVLPDGYAQLGEPWKDSYQVPADAVEFELPAIEVVGTHKLSGRLIDEKDQPLAGAQLMAVENNRRYAAATTDLQGRFTMNVPDGVETTFELHTDERGPEPVETVTQDPLVVRYAGAPAPRGLEAERKSKADVTLTGRVLLGGKPLAGVTMTLSRGVPIMLGRVGMRMSLVADTVTDADGRYRLSGLKAGDSYQMRVEAPFPAADPTWTHQFPWLPKLPDDAHGEVALPDLNLRKLNQTLAGKVVDPDGKPVEGARVSAMLRDGQTSVPRTSMSLPPPWTETDQQGRFKLEQLPDVPLALMAYILPKTGNQIRFPAKVDVELNQQDIRIVLDPSLVDEEE